MWRIIKGLAWILTGVVGAHAGHFIYQKYYLKDFSGMKFSESIAVISERLLYLSQQYYEKTIPLLMAHKQITLSVIGLVVFLMLVFIWFKVRAKSKPERDYRAKLKEAETIAANAQKKAAAEMQKIEALKKEMAAEFENKEKSLESEAETIVADAQQKAADEMQKAENLKKDISAEFKIKERAIKKEAETIVANEQKKAAVEMQKAEALKKEMLAKFENKENELKKKAETIVADAKKKAAAEMQKVETLKKK